ncbi:voltage-dependent T-type calcium channel subunit alpha-1G isoform X4 [Hermetia illucens]|uniref:voltage-dependent T-type calcium channel subunit alpha-1G isoform X4 n=1 Tax=Hermetia illucens TaxID=343691 RepID=UPI0018CC38D6|nr:voltage-dependent T-type calcium channel subunit alpha-1G isoform X4 [Hermetia illucens]
MLFPFREDRNSGNLINDNSDNNNRTSNEKKQHKSTTGSHGNLSTRSHDASNIKDRPGQRSTSSMANAKRTSGSCMTGTAEASKGGVIVDFSNLNVNNARTNASVTAVRDGKSSSCNENLVSNSVNTTNTNAITNKRNSDDDRATIASLTARSQTRQRRHRHSSVNNGCESYSSSHSTMHSSGGSSSGSTSCSGSCSDDGESTTSSGEPNLPYPGFPEIALKYLTQDTRPRNWCLLLITNPWFERVSILVILLNCITLGMYQPCVDDACVTNRCKILQIFDDIIFAFFALEMTIKMVAMGIYGKNTYLADSWNRLDFFIVLAGLLEYVMHVENLNLTAIRTIRVLRPLRAINRIPSMRILVMLLLDTLPMLGNVLLLCFFVFFIFGIVGVQLWEGILRQRCVLQLPPNVIAPNISFYYEYSKEQDYICSKPDDSGMHLCSNLPPYRVGPMLCDAYPHPFSMNYPTNKSCVNWNQFYTNCTQLGSNPFQGTISFDNIGLAWVAIFLVISLEGWTDIMYYVQDAHSFWDWIYFVLLIVIGSFFMINLCLVVIATQFSETKKREMERMRQERARYTSTSTLASSTNNSEPTTCYAEIVKYIAHLWRRSKRRLLKKYRLYKCQRQQRKEGLLPNAENLTFSPSRIKAHHPKCPKFGRKPSNIQEQMITVMVPLNSNNNLNLQSSTQNVNLNVSNNNNNHNNHEHNSSPENSEHSAETSRASNLKKVNHKDDISQKTILLKIPTGSESEQLINPCNSGFLSPPTSARRRSSVMFNDYVILHTPPPIPEPTTDKNVCSSEKMTQAGDGSIWQVNLPQSIGSHAMGNAYTDCSELSLNDAMTCQELLAFSVAFSAALPTGQSTLESFYSSLTHQHNHQPATTQANLVHSNSRYLEDYSCCYDLYQNALDQIESREKKHSKLCQAIITVYKFVSKIFHFIRKHVKALVEYKYFQQGILLAILINTLSMGIEYHNQPEELTVIVETSNIVFSAIFAVEMFLKVIAEGPFRYIANGFNVFDGVIVILSGIEICQQFFGDGGGGNSGLSVLRTFRLLRILKLVRFMPNLRRQLFVMLRTMDNVAIFFSLLVLFIFIFSILGMNLFGCKFCEKVDGEMECDRKNFDSLLWALVTVFQILTQEDWNVVLFNGMEKTSHWAALYFVALMTFGNYVLFNLLVAILVEGFSSERNERREREQRELVKKLREENMVENFSDIMYEESRSGSDSSSTNESYYDVKNKWHSAEELRKIEEANQSKTEPKCNIQKQRLLQPNLDYNINELTPTSEAQGSANKTSADRDFARINEDDKKILKKTYSIKERRYDNSKTGNLRSPCNPPIIMTTAATPQDSPNTTLESGTTFKNWSQQNLDGIALKEQVLKSFSTPSLLKPPSTLIGQRIADERLPTIDISPPSAVGSLLDLKSVNSSNNYLNTMSSTNLTERLVSNERHKENTDPQAEPNSMMTRSSSFKRFRRTSSKKSKKVTDTEDEPVILNNDRDWSKTNNSVSRTSSFLQPANRIQNDTRDANVLTPRNSIRRSSTIGRRASCIYNNTQFYHNLNRQTSIKNYRMSRRMSSIELAFEKASNMNINNIENRNSLALRSSKIDLDKWQKSLSNLNIPESQPPAATQPAPLQESTQIGRSNSQQQQTEHVTKLKILIELLKPTHFIQEREDYSLYLFPEDNRFRHACIWFVNQKWFDNAVLLFIALNCITLAMERPNIPPTSSERFFLATANYIFTVVFTVEMFVKVVAAGMFYGQDAYFTSGWNIMDGSLVTVSIIDLLMSLVSESSPRIFGILRVFRLLRSLRPLRVINRAPGLKLVVQTLLSSLRPIGNIVLICCTFFIIFGILGVQLFKGTFYYCEGEHTKGVKNKTDCLAIEGNVWVNRKYNFDDLGKALMSLFVLSSRDGWVNIMYTGLDAVGVDQQPIPNYNEWRLLYFIAFILLVGFFVLNMFVGVVVENFHRCREEQEKEEKIRRAAKRALQMEKKRRRMHEPPYYTNYSPTRMFVHNVVTSKYFDLAIAAVIGLNVVTMAMEYYMMPVALEYALKIFNYFFTAVFILEAIMKLVALGFKLYMKDKWNQLDVGIVILSIVGIVLEELETNIIPINPTIIRVMRVLRIARVLKLLKMAKGIRALLDTVMQALPQVGNLGLLFFLLFFIFAALGVELFGRLECSEEIPCQGLGEHAHFANFGMAFLTLFRVATGDNWNGIMKDTLRDNCDDAADCVKNCCVSTVIAPIFFVIFVLMAQFVLVNVVVAVLMKHLEESHKQMEDELDMDTELEREFVREQEFEEEQALCLQLQEEPNNIQKRPLEKVSSLPSNFTYSTPSLDKKYLQRRQTIQFYNQTLGLTDLGGQAFRKSPIFDEKDSITEEAVENSFNETEDQPPQDNQTQTPKLSKPKRTSILRRKMLTKERSLDEHAQRRRRLETKRMSCDNLPWRSEARRTIFEATEFDAEPETDMRKFKSEEYPTVKSDLGVDLDPLPEAEPKHHEPDLVEPRTKNRQVTKSISLDPNPKSSFLVVPRSMPPRSRSGSTKQLFKQKALDEDPDIDESSLLLPTASRSQHTGNGRYDQINERQESLSKSDSAEILRIISERRRMDKRDTCGNEDSDYNELLLVKSPQSSMEA